jgi:type VII secretion integral membrane protein EccD
MTDVDSRSYCRVAVVAPHTRIDLALPVDVPVIDLLPMLLDYAGEAHESGGGDHGGWALRAIGKGELDGGRTLRSLDVVDGDLLQLAAQSESTSPVVFDDMVDAIAAAARDQGSTRSANPGIGSAAILVAALAAAVAVLYRTNQSANAYISGAIAIVLLAIATATAKGAQARVAAVAIGAAGLPFALLCGSDAVPGAYGHWSLLLGCALSCAYSLGALLSLGTGAAVFSAATTASVLGGLSALVAGLANEPADNVVAGTIAVAVGLLGFLPRLSIRLANLPITAVPLSAEQLSEQDDTGDLRDITTRARLAGEYLLGTLIGAAGTVALTAIVLIARNDTLSIALAAVGIAGVALRARSTTRRGARVALLSASLAAGLGASLSIVYLQPTQDFTTLLFADLAVLVVAIFLTVAAPRMRVSPTLPRLVNAFEAILLVSVLPLAVGAIGLYGTLRHL